MDWLDIDDIAAALKAAHPDADPAQVRFRQLKDWVLALPGFAGLSQDVNERKLEAIQAAWLGQQQDKDEA